MVYLCDGCAHDKFGGCKDGIEIYPNAILCSQFEMKDGVRFNFELRKWEFISPEVEDSCKKAHFDVIEHPKHYNAGKYEVFPVLLDWFPDRPILWQVGKYIARAFHKGNPLVDLKKARWYLDKQIELLEGKKNG